VQNYIWKFTAMCQILSQIMHKPWSHSAFENHIQFIIHNEPIILKAQCSQDPHIHIQLMIHRTSTYMICHELTWIAKRSKWKNKRLPAPWFTILNTNYALWSRTTLIQVCSMSKIFRMRRICQRSTSILLALGGSIHPYNKKCSRFQWTRWKANLWYVYKL
jgi:hypothetical protein